jgi:asparagine synthase (glutamine-hydrolysing)
VPLGVFLSGGIDSSAIVAMMSELMDPSDIKTFSIGFKENSYDESGAAALVARHFGTDHHERIIGPETLIGALPDMMRIIDEPFADSSIIPTYLVSKFAREGITVALGGDGGDELFMGYPSFLAYRAASIYDALPIPGKDLALGLAVKMLPGAAEYLSLHFKASRFLRGVRFPKHLRHQLWVGSMPPDEQASLFLDRASDDIFDPMVLYDESIAYFKKFANISDLDKAEYIYIKTYLTDDILTKVDRASMATSLEVRAPFLDKEMAGLSGMLSNKLKLNRFTQKYIIKESMKGILPDDILRKPKHGFAVPLGRWFRGELKEKLLEIFDPEKIKKEGVFDPDYIKTVFDHHFAGKTDNGRKIWSLFIYEMWYDNWIKKDQG